jgi:hypothetical protein
LDPVDLFRWYSPERAVAFVQVMVVPEAVLRWVWFLCWCSRLLESAVSG